MLSVKINEIVFEIRYVLAIDRKEAYGLWRIHRVWPEYQVSQRSPMRTARGGRYDQGPLMGHNV
jgi:hypothetical protein